jgi:hypothetical protein
MSNFLKWLLVVLTMAILIVAAAFMLPPKPLHRPQPVVAEQTLTPKATPVANPHEKLEPLINVWAGHTDEVPPFKPLLTREQSFFDELYCRAQPAPDIKFGVSPKARPYNHRVTEETLPFQVMAQKSFPDGWPRAIWIEHLKMRAVVIPMADECNVTLYEYPDHIEICYLAVRYEHYANVGFVKTMFSLDTPRNNTESLHTAHRFVWEKVQEIKQIDAGMIDPDVSMAFDSSSNRMHEKPGHLKQVDFRRQIEIFDQLYREAPELQQHLYSLSTRSFFSALIHMPQTYPIHRLVKVDGEGYLVIQGRDGKNLVLAKRRLIGITYIQVIEAAPGTNAGQFAQVKTRIASDKFLAELAVPMMLVLEKAPPPPPVRQPTDFSQV